MRAMRKVTICVMIALSLCGQATALGQENVARAKRIEKAIKTKDAKRKLKESINGGRYIQQDWTAEGHKISVSIYEYPSAEDAVRVMEIGERGVAAVEVKEKLHGIGDEATYHTNRRGAYTSLILRKGNVVVTINGASLKLVKAFAKDIADELAH